MFQRQLHDATPRHEKVYGFYERLYTTIDFLAGLTFLLGSVLFFWQSTQEVATWAFVIGSALFVARPASRFAREYHLARLPLPGDDD
ncbi:YrhK family protein [Sagittula salina]|uniref:YrhK family protein n=1 Tax=Sagittula salina TaxID=2820268 RepID=A0A940MTQ5_9RHOB|nr:YrhK family protein [Sagittula salina]MBP0484882.1 YrhK family protein [Sagittula salina]